MTMLHDAIPSIITPELVNRALEHVAADLGITYEETLARVTVGLRGAA
jgi:hypothetical protein